MVNFGNRLKKAMGLRERPGPVTVTELSAQCEVSYQAVKKWLQSPTPKLSAESALVAAKYLGVDLVWLLTGKGQMQADGANGFERALLWLADEMAALDSDKRAGVKVYVAQVMDACDDRGRVLKSIALANAIIQTKQTKAA